MKISFSDRVIIEAKNKGYYCDEHGNIFSPNGHLHKGGKTKHGHRTFSPAAYPDNKRGCALQHRFIAYYFFGDEIFNHRCVRHKNDIPNDNRIENLALGSYKDNAMDMPVEKRKERSKGAGERIREQSRKLSNLDVLKIRELRDVEKIPFYKIAKIFNISKMTAYRAATRKAWAHL